MLMRTPRSKHGGGERGRPSGLLQQQPHAIVRNPVSTSIPTNVELSTRTPSKARAGGLEIGQSILP